MALSKLAKFKKEREALNEVVMEYANLNIKKLYNLDMRVYKKGALDAGTKELLGLVSSFVLRCDDCILYHLGRCRDEGVSDEELVEALSVGMIVGGTITIPHLRRALKAWSELK
ncbi:MAG: carboxymuconolactone decarboxylase family protein [Pseudomonadota bacterium]